MNSRKVPSLLIVCSSLLLAALASLTPAVLAQDLSETVLPITQLKWIGLGAEGKFGTGFCVDRDCRFVGTNYHVAVTAWPRKIKGAKSHPALPRYWP